jgi:hypothetical protein
MTADNDLRIPQNASRCKNNAIQWMRENIQHMRWIIPPATRETSEQGWLEAGVSRNRAMIPRVRRWLEAKFGHRPQMADMIATAIALAGSLQTPHDRQAKRNRDAL